MTASADSLSDDDAETNRATETETAADSEAETDTQTATEPNEDEDGSSPASSQQSGDPENPPHRDTGNEPVDPQTRKRMLAEHNYRCQTCGRTDPSHGGVASLEVHHIERDPDGMAEDDPANLTVLCHSCHTWFHNRSTIEDSPVTLTAADRMHLLPQDIEIIQYFNDDGPARTGAIADGISVDQSATSIRDRLWRLMELDNLVDERDRQIIDKDVETGEWA